MYLKTFHIRNFRGWRDEARFSLERGLNLVIGNNGQGKSSTLNAVEWCLYGNMVEKKACGLEERREWEAPHRNPVKEPTMVKLLFSTDQGDLVITRRRSKGALASKDLFTIHQPGADPQSLNDIDFPHWEAWKRSFCCHQEGVRRGVMDPLQRTSALASLLGLEEDMRLRRRLQDLKTAGFVRDLNRVKENLKKDLIVMGQSLDQELQSLKKDLSNESYETVRNRAIVAMERAEPLARKFGARDAIPRQMDLQLFLDWAAELLQNRYHADKFYQNLGQKLHDLEDTMKGLGELKEEKELLSQHSLADGNWARAKAALKEADGMRALLTDAKNLITPHEQNCPVCGARAEDLHQRIRDALKGGREKEFSRLQEDAERWEEEKNKAKKRLADFSALKEKKARLEAEFESVARKSQGLEIPALRKLVEAEEASTKEGFDLLEGDYRRVSAFMKYERIKNRKDPQQSVAWSIFSDELRDALDFAEDLESIHKIVRKTQKHRSERRAEQVNEFLGGFYSAIMGGDDHRKPMVKIKETPKMLKYEIQDQDNKPALPVLNQASANALSLSLLLAQAEERAIRNLPIFLVLDEPGQGLDQDHLLGLAGVIKKMSKLCTVLVGLRPGPLAAMLDQGGAHVFQLGDFSPEEGCRLLSS